MREPSSGHCRWVQGPRPTRRRWGANDTRYRLAERQQLPDKHLNLVRAQDVAQVGGHLAVVETVHHEGQGVENRMSQVVPSVLSAHSGICPGGDSGNRRADQVVSGSIEWQVIQPGFGPRIRSSKRS